MICSLYRVWPAVTNHDSLMMSTFRRLSIIILAIATSASAQAGPDHVDITWMSITNMYYDLGSLGIITDGYFSRIPQSAFYGSGGGLGRSRAAFKPDVAAVRRVLSALGGPSKVNVLLTGHSHFDHSFDTGTWAHLTGARVIGSKTTCFQVEAERISRGRCTVVNGGEKIVLASGVTMWVVRWNHSGDPAINPEQHNPVELNTVPTLDSVTGGMRPGVAEDFPNGGGTRAFLFTVDGPDGRFSWFFQNSASAVDLAMPVVVDGVNYGAPIENLRVAMKNADVSSVDLWIGTGGQAVALLVVPILKPKAFLPVHWDGLWGAFHSGVVKSYADPALEAYLAQSGITFLKPRQYMDKWHLDRSGVKAIGNAAVKQSLGFAP